MTWESDTPVQSCGGCGTSDTVLLFIPGGWGWVDEKPGRDGLCVVCGTENPQYKEIFREHFGEVVLVSDGDAAHGETGVAGT